MARFKYSLQGILELKKKMETMSKQEFANAQGELMAEEHKRDELVARKEDYLKKSGENLKGDLDIRSIKENMRAVKLMDGFIEDQEKKVRASQVKVDIAREKLSESIKERKIHENLREKAFNEFTLEENRKESKTIDELTSYTYGQKKAEENKAWGEKNG